MEDSLNKSTGDNLIDLKLNEDLNVNLDTSNSEQGLLASNSVNQEDPKKGKSTGNPPPKKPKEKKVEPIKDSAIPHIIPEKGLLDDIGSQIHSDTESAQPKLVNKDLREAARLLNKQIGYVDDGNVEQLDKTVAKAQSNWKQAGNAVARVGLKLLPETLAQLGNALDFEDYANTDDEVGNWLTNAMTKLENKADKALPIYRENPNESLAVTDPAWWFENAEKLTTSIGGFAGAGFITAGAVEFSTLRGAKALATLAKLAKGAEIGGELGASTVNALGKINTVSQAVMLNQAESVGIGLDTYNISYKRALEKLQADPSSFNKTKEQLNNEAKQIAADDASSAIAFNRWNIALNLTSASLFFKKPTNTRFTLDKLTKLGTIKEVTGEGLQEGLEENINDQSQNQALDKNYSFTDALKYSLTAKGAESSLLGFVGGAGNTILTHAGKFIPMHDNTVYRETYVNEYTKAQKEGLSEEEADAKAQGIAEQKAGTNKKRISAYQQHNQRYIQQQDNQVSYNERLANDNISDAILNLTNTADLTALHKELDLAIKQGDKVKADTLQSILVGAMAQNAFSTGTTEGLLALWDGYANLTHEEAEARNMYKKGDENTPEYYKTIAKDTKEHIEKLEGLYNTSKKYLNSQEVFDLQERKLVLDNRLEKNYKAITDKFKEAEETYKDDKLKHPSFNSTYLDLESPSGYNINKVVPAFRQTEEYKTIKALNDASKQLVELKAGYQDAINKVTTDSYQKELGEAIIRNRNRIANEAKTEKKEKIHNEVKKNNLGKVKAWTEEAISKVTNSTIIDTNELKGDNLPVVENEEVSVKKEIKPTNINTDSIKDKPRFVEFSKYDEVVDSNLDKLKNDLSSGEFTAEENLKKVNDIYNKMSGARQGVASQFPLKAKDFEKDLNTLENTLKEIKDDVDAKTSSINTLKNIQEELVNSLLEDDNTPLTENQSGSPRTNIDFNKSKKESDLMFSALENMQNLGIDINDFKSVLTSFEQNTSKDAVVKAFIKLKGLYIASTGNDVDGTYEDLMYTDSEKNQVINDFNNSVRKFSIPEDRYVSTLDPTTIEIINQHKEAARLSDLDVTDAALGYEIYNETASNLLAYLSKLYELKYTNKKSATGKEYIMVTKNDVTDLLNPNLDDKILNPDFLKVGDKIKFVPLKSVQLEDGTILNTDTLKEEDKIPKTPIGIEVNGEIIKGVFLHDTDWINMTNTDLTATGVKQDQARLNLVRSIIINNGGFETTITNKTPGVPIVNTDDTLHTVLELTPNVEIGISKSNAIYKNNENTVEVINNSNIKEGQQVIIIPFGSKKLALPVSRAKLDSHYINSITTAVSLYLDGKATDLSKELKEQYGYDVLTSKGLEAYLHNFINLSNSLKAKTFEGFTDRIGAIDDSASIISMINGELMFGRGTGIRVNNISKSKYNDELGKPLQDKSERITTDIQTLAKHLASTYTNINLDLLGKNIKIPVITTEGKVEVEHDNYNDFAKANMYSKYMSMKLSDGTEIYTIQGKINYDIDGILKNNKSKTLVESVNEDSSVNTEKQDKLKNLESKLESITKTKEMDDNFNNLPNEFFEYLNLVFRPEFTGNKSEFFNIYDLSNSIYIGELLQDSFAKIIKSIKNTNAYKGLIILDNKTKVKSQQKSETITLPNGKTFNPDDVNTQDFSPLINNAEVSYQLKSVELLQSDKAKEICTKGEKNNWTLDKMLSELQIPKEQKELLLNLEDNKDSNAPLNEWLALQLASNYSYSVEVNTAKTQTKNNKEFASGEDIIIKDGKYYYYDPSEDSYTETTKDNYNKWKKEQNDESFTNTKYYSNLTVPGGTNYTENEIATPAITPSIKGHAQFATDNGIGWFRSDDKNSLSIDKNYYNRYLKTGLHEGQFSDYEDVVDTEGFKNWYVEQNKKDNEYLSTDVKTRRILEVQSDLFQKGRNKEDLINKGYDESDVYNGKTPEFKHNGDTYKGVLENFSEDGKDFPDPAFYRNSERISTEEYNNAFTEYSNNIASNTNQFLQLLNKNNNWVTFFVKSIIQDSAKKGYEKVLFPSGNTASKVEGHTTLEEFKKQKQDRIKQLEEINSNFNKERIDYNRITLFYSDDVSDETILKELKEQNNKEINQLKEELERVEGPEGFGALKPIYNFYENTVTNILKKQGYNSNQITDEYGNTWNEVQIEYKHNNTISLSPLTDERNTANHDYLLETSSFIKGLTIGTQTSIIKTIANDIYNEFLEHTDKGAFTFDVKKQVDLAIQGFDLIKNNYIDREDARAQFVASQVDIIVENRDKILEAVRQILTPKIKDVSSVNYNDNLDETTGLEAGDNDEIKIYSDKSEYIIDPRTKLTKEVKQFLEGIPQRKLVDTGETKEYITITNALGLNNFISSDIVFNDIQSIVAKSNSNSGFNAKANAIDEQFNTKMLPNIPSYVRNFVISLSKQVDSKPYLYGVIQKVVTAEPHLQNAIVSAFNKAHTHHIFLQSTYNSDTKKWSLTKNVAASKSVTNLVMSQWSNNISYSDITDITDKGININKEAVTKFKKDFNLLATGKEDITPKSLNDLLNQIGIDIPLPLFSILSSGKFKQNGKEQTLLQSFNLSDGIFKNIYDRVSQFDTNFSDALTLDTNSLFDDNSFRSLAKLIGRYTDNLFNSNFKNGNGDTVYGFSNDRYFVNRQVELKTNVDLLKQLSSSIFTTGSQWLKGLLDLSGDTPSINKNSYMYKYFEYYTGDSMKVKNNALGKTIDQFSADELEKFNWGLYQNEGKVRGKGAEITPIITVLYPTMEEKSNIFALQVPGKHYELEEGQLKSQDVKDLVRQMFYPEISRIRAFNQNPDRVNVKEYKQGGKYFLMFPALNYLHDLYDGRELNEDGSIKEFGNLKEIFGAYEESLLGKQVVNYFRNQAKERVENWRKYGIVKTDNNGEYLAYVDDNYAKNFDATKLKQIIYNYNINTVVANVNIQQLFISDIAAFTKNKTPNDFLRISKNTAENQTKRLAVDNAAANEILHEPNETFNLLVVNDVITASHPLVMNYLKELWEGHKNYKDIIDTYSKINSTDAQEFTTLKEHVSMMFKEGKITKEQLDNILNDYYDDGKISEQNKQLILQPYKLRYGNNINRNGENLRLHIKSSSFPLVRELTEGTPLEDLRRHMVAYNIDRIAFGSAVKVGQPLQLATLFDEEGNFIKPTDVELGMIRNVPRQGHGNQQENPYDENSNQVNDGTQQSKEFLTNLLEVDGFIHPITGEEVKGKQIAETYHENYHELFKNKYNDLIEKLDYNRETGIVNNLTHLQKLLKEEGVNRNYNANDILGLELNEYNTNFAVPLWLNASGIKIESLVSSIVDNRIRKRLFRGKSLIMGSNVGSKINTLDSINKSDVITVGDWDGTLKSSYNKDGQMTYAEVIAPFKFWDNNGKALKLETFLNPDGTLDLNRLPESLLETFGYRIPTSGINLMTTIKVVGFLPNNKNVAYGDILIAPDDFIAQMGLDFDVDKLYAHMYNTYYSDATKSLRKIDKVTSDFLINNKGVTSMKPLDVHNAYLENILLDTHKAVLNNPAKEVQQARTKPLSFGELPNLVKLFDVAPINRYFTPMSNMYQQGQYISARAGKAAVGVFSLDMVFNSVVQHIEEPMEFFDTDGKTTKVFKTNLFGQTNEPINSTKTIKGDKFKSDVIEAFMASALDNGNEQILGKLNINNHTFDFVRAATASGYDENTIITITMQPIIQKYVESKQLNNPFNLDLKSDVKLANVKLQDAQDIIIKPDADKSFDTDLQKSIFKEFLRLTEKGAELKRVQSAINSDSSGVGKNIFYSIEKAKQITELPNSTSISNVEKLIGDYKYMSEVNSQEELDALKADGYILYNGTLIKPNSLGGFAGVYATLLNAELWNDYFPYNNEKFRNITNYSFKGKNDLKDTLSDKAKQQQQVSENYKSLLTSNTYHLFGNYNSITEARQKLLYDNDNNQALGSIIADLKEENRKDPKKGYTNLLLGRLLINRGKKLMDDGKLPTTIEYYNSGNVEMDEQQVIHSFIDMIVNNKSLGSFNGEELTTRDLANQLILHQIINGAIQRSNQFIKFIPFKYLQKLGYYDTLENTNNMFDNITSNDIAERLRTQTIQHYPEQYYSSDIEEFVKPFIQDNKIVGIDSETTKGLDIIVTKSTGDRYDIWKFNPETYDYNKIDNLGYNGILEYDISKEVGKSNIYINQVEDNSVTNLKDDIIEQNTDNKIIEVSKDYGVIKTDTNPSKEETQQFVNLIKPQAQKQTYKENKGAYANEMFHYGLMWSRVKPKSNPVNIKSFEKAGYYAYHELDQNGNKLPPISDLQPIINKIQKEIGIDMSNYDSVIGNIYLDGQYVYPHKDTTESISARKYPVIVYTIGNNAGLGIVDNNKGKMTFANQYDKKWLPEQDKLKGYTNELLTKNGSIYTFGLDGKGRFELTHSTPIKSKKQLDFPPITLPNGEVITKYTITLTFRRAQDTNIVEPKKLNTNKQVIQNSEPQLSLFSNEATEYIPPISDSVNFLRLDRDRTQDNSPLIYNTEAKDIVKTFNLDDTSLSIEDKYRVILNEVKDTTNNPILSYFADKLQDVVPYLSETPLKVDTNIKAKGITETSPILGEPVSIKINPNAIKNSQEMGEVLIEEITHAILKSELGNNTSEFTRNINSLREEVKKSLINKYGQSKYDSMVNKLASNLPLEKNIEADLMYSVYNNDEFVAAAIKNKSFQQFLNSTEATHITKSLWQKFISAIRDLLVKLGVKADSNLEAVLHETINLFDKVNKGLHTELNTPKFVRTIEYLNSKFNLTDDSSNSLTKGNSDAIADFINKTIVNVNAISQDNKVLLNYINPNLSLSPETIDEEEFGNSGELVTYIQSLELRKDKLQLNIRKAKENNDLHKAELLQLDLDKDIEKLSELSGNISAVALANKAGQDLQVVETILKRPMGSEDIVYVKHIVNFWQNAKEHIFSKSMYENPILSGMYGNIESKAETLDHKLFLIQKDFTEGFIKKYIGSNVDLDQMFEDYKDINGLQGNFRDISTYDNDILTSMWYAVKEAEIKAQDESNQMLEKHDTLLKPAVQVLKSLGNRETFMPYMQLTDRSKQTGQLISPYNSKFFTEKSRLVKSVNKEEDAGNMNKYVNWLNDNSVNTDLFNIFPQDGKVTEETIKLRNDLKSKVGEAKYNYWFTGQEKKLANYNKSREHIIEHIISDFDLKSEDDINNSKDALNRYESWVRRNSPYYLEKVVHEDRQFANHNYNFKSQDYYEILSVDEKHLDKRFSTIENNKALLNYYNEVRNVFDELRKYIPHYQVQDFLYGGIPAIEKSIIETFSENGMVLGYKAIREAMAKSVQSSFGDNSSVIIDPVTNDKVKQMRVSLIKNNGKEINNYITQKKAEYLLKNKEEASKEKIKEFREDIVDEISKRNSFDLGKITKVFATLVLSYKHKARIEDDIKVINSVFDSYQETRLRPDGTPEVNSVKGTVERKDKSQSFLNAKKARDYYVGNVLYNEIKDEEGKGSIKLTPSEKEKQIELNTLLEELEKQHDAQIVDDVLYKDVKTDIEKQLNSLGKTAIYSKRGDNVLKYIQLKLMGWNFLGGIANITFGYVANKIEAAGGQIYNNKDLREAYKIVSASTLKNATFNKVEIGDSKKIRSIMDKFDVLKDASKELYSDSVKSDLNKKVQWLAPYNMNQRGEYINQSVLMIALFKNTKIDTIKGEVNLYDALDSNGQWNTAEYGEKPEQIINRTRIKLDQLIKKLHGNYDNLSPLAVKKTILGRAGSQFRTFLFENIAERFQDEREDKVLGITVKGRYRSAADVYTSTNLMSFAGSVLTGILKNYSLGLYKGGTFEGLTYKDGSTISELDASNMRKVAMEATIAMNLYLAMTLLKAVIGGDDDDENNIYNMLFNQGVRLRTDLVMYVNPIELRNMAKDIIPAFNTIGEIGKWMGSVEDVVTGNGTYTTGVHNGDSKFIRSTNKLIPFVSKIQSTLDSGEQMFGNNGR